MLWWPVLPAFGHMSSRALVVACCKLCGLTIPVSILTGHGGSVDTINATCSPCPDAAMTDGEEDPHLLPIPGVVPGWRVQPAWGDQVTTTVQKYRRTDLFTPCFLLRDSHLHPSKWSVNPTPPLQAHLCMDTGLKEMSLEQWLMQLQQPQLSRVGVQGSGSKDRTLPFCAGFCKQWSYCCKGLCRPTSSFKQHSNSSSWLD